MLVSRLFTSATPPRIAAARRPHLLVLAVEYVFQATRIHEHAAAVKRGKPNRLLRRKGRHLFEEAVNGPPHQFTHRAILLAGHGPESLHHRVREKNLNLLHGSML
jgi:hypothetical protein